MIKQLVALSTLLALVITANSASAGLVSFKGTVSLGGPGILGQIPVPDPARPFTLSLNFTDGSGFTPFLGNITSGTFNIPAQTFNVVAAGSVIIMANNASPIDDTAQFIVQVAGPTTGQLIFTFSRDAINAAVANQPNVIAMIIDNTTQFTADFSAAGQGTYTGDITGIPEPSSCLALIGCVIGGYYKLRRKKVAATIVA